MPLNFKGLHRVTKISKPLEKASNSPTLNQPWVLNVAVQKYCCISFLIPAQLPDLNVSGED